MRKISYVTAFVVVTANLAINAISTASTNWMVLVLPKIFDVQTTVYYGFTKRCQRAEFPDGEVSLKCQPFPTKDSDACDQKYGSFCTLWSTASYISYLAIGFGAVACTAIAFGVSTHSRRKRIWKVVAALIALHGLSQLVTFILVTDTYRLGNFPLSTFATSRLGYSWYLNLLSWVLSMATTVVILYTGVAASRGERWAAGNRVSYGSIPR